MNGEQLFRIYCVSRGDALKGQFLSREEATAAGKWARENLPDFLGYRTRVLRHFVCVFGHPLYELTVKVASLTHAG
jgi:hypothetical protein